MVQGVDRTLVQPASRFLVVAAVLLILAAPASAAGIKTGIFDPWSFTDASMRDEAFRRSAEDAGASMVRLVLDWHAVAPGGATKPVGFVATNPRDTNYNWASFDSAMELAHLHGLDVIVNIHHAPDWAEGAGTGPDGTVRPNPTELALFATAAATRYNGDFDPSSSSGTDFLPAARKWLVWNEPNLNTQLNPQYQNGHWVSPGIYRRMVNAVSRAVHDVNQDNIVIAGATAPFGYRKANAAPMVFMRRLLCMNSRNKPVSGCPGGVHFDLWAHHPYTQGGPTHHAVRPDNVSFGDLPEMKALLRSAVRTGHVVSARRVGFWITEFSWDSRPPDRRGVRSGLEARWVAEAIYRAQTWGIGALIWFMIRDQAFPASQYQSALYYCGGPSASDDGVCAADPSLDKPKSSVLKAFSFPFVAFDGHRHVRVWGRTPNGVPDQVWIERRTSRGWHRVGTLSTNSSGFFGNRYRSRLTKGLWRATLVSSPAKHSVPFSLTAPPDVTLNNPFGCGGTLPC
jgi:Cellulase (glycosyl hydrolase family 5)